MSRAVAKHKLAAGAFTVLSVYILIGLFSESYSLYCAFSGKNPLYEESDMSHAYESPSSQHWIGTDYKGRDVFWRAFFAVKTAIKIGVIASGISMLIGVVLGALAGYFGGWVDDVTVWIYSTFAAMPSLLFILAFSLLVTKGFMHPYVTESVKYFTDSLNLFLCFLHPSLARVVGAVSIEPGMLALYLGIGLTGWVSLCRVVRAEVMKLRDGAFVQAARCLGFGDMRIIFRHILPNVFHLVIIYFTMRFAYAIMTEVIVSYLGLGVQLEPSWGVMISDGQQRLWRGVWWEVGAATGFMFFFVLSLHIAGDALRDILDPRLKT